MGQGIRSGQVYCQHKDASLEESSWVVTKWRGGEQALEEGWMIQSCMEHIMCSNSFSSLKTVLCDGQKLVDLLSQCYAVGDVMLDGTLGEQVR